VGGDALKGRVKYVQGSTEVRLEGLIVIVSNYPLRARDGGSNAIFRRMREFLAEKMVLVKRDLIRYNNKCK
jgi:hypothetical protein